MTRERLPQAAPRALDDDELLAFVRAAERASFRDRAIGLLLAYAGLRLSELVALDLDDARVSGRKALVVVRSGKGDAYRGLARIGAESGAKHLQAPRGRAAQRTLPDKLPTGRVP